MAKPRASTKREAPLKKAPDIDLPEDVKKEGRRKRDALLQFFSPIPPKDGKFKLDVPPDVGVGRGIRKVVAAAKAIKNPKTMAALERLAEKSGKVISHHFGKQFTRLPGGKVLETSRRSASRTGSSTFGTIGDSKKVVRLLDDLPEAAKQAARKKRR